MELQKEKEKQDLMEDLGELASSLKQSAQGIRAGLKKDESV